MKLSFQGATGTVTGSRYLLEDDREKYLIDCGLFQGSKDIRARNWENFPWDPKALTSVLLTHAHLDHSGCIPKLAKAGFQGPILATEATYDLCKIILPDCGHIQEDDARLANKYGYSTHQPALPLYTQADAESCLKLFRTVAFGQTYPLGHGQLEVMYHRAGHILGASSIRVSDGKTSIVFSGDLGRMNDPVMKAPTQIQTADYIVVESTYGDRLHNRSDPLQQLEDVILRTIHRGGTVLVPAFAVGRAQALLYYIHKLKTSGRLPAHVPVYLDSPMAINVSGLLEKHSQDHRLSKTLAVDMCAMAHYVHTREDSIRLDTHSILPSIIISASGMATGGRILHHLKAFSSDPRHTILLVGFQANGTRGDRLSRGEKEIKIHGKIWPVKAEVAKLDTLSAHADYGEVITWLKHFTSRPRLIFITHGEPKAAAALGDHIKEELGWEYKIPAYKETVEI